MLIDANFKEAQELFFWALVFHIGSVSSCCPSRSPCQLSFCGISVWEQLVIDLTNNSIPVFIQMLGDGRVYTKIVQLVVSTCLHTFVITRGFSCFSCFPTIFCVVLNHLGKLTFRWPKGLMCRKNVIITQILTARSTRTFNFLQISLAVNKCGSSWYLYMTHLECIYHLFVKSRDELTELLLMLSRCAGVNLCTSVTLKALIR